jgi:hypothetical protein
MGRFSGMEISSSLGLKNPQKLAQGRIPRAVGPLEAKIFFPMANF